MRWLFLLAYTCSGLAGLVYEVTWTRLLTLYIGHSTAAASAVVAAFLGGLAVGAGVGGAIASKLPPRRSLHVYIALELVVALAALLLPLEITALTPLLSWAYNDGAGGWLFPLIRVLACLVMVFLPAAALGATFPMAIQWFATGSDDPARSSGALYAANTAGAAVGALLAGFVLIPAIGLSGATTVGIAASAVAAISVLVILKAGVPSRSLIRDTRQTQAPGAGAGGRRKKRRSAKTPAATAVVRIPHGQWIATSVLGLSGFAALMHEIVWTRILALVLGPTIYAFAATLATVIGGMAIGSGLGTWVAARARHPAAWLACTLTAGAITSSLTFALAGQEIPRLVAHQMAALPSEAGPLFRHGAVLTTLLILPTAVLLGAAFPLGLSIVGDRTNSVSGPFALVYAVNTLGAVTGSLAAGFIFIPLVGLQTTLRVVGGCLIATIVIVLVRGALSRRGQIAGALGASAAAALLVFSPPWDRELLASGAYLYAPFVPKDLDLETQLKAGTVLYYREGATATVSVKRLTGTTTLAVDGKVDASNRADMLTQKLVAHLPLLLHPNPRDVAIIGLGSGVTVGAALRHPIARADVLEISPEVVEASHYFAAENQHALDDPRTHLIVGDGRSHLLLSQRQYDVIISEPSNPWIAGVAALFTQEFFVAARTRLAPGGIICQWANGYNISDTDLRAIVATFRSVFPDGAAWLVGGDDLLLVGSTSSAPLDTQLGHIRRHWARPGVAEDLAQVSALEPFSLLSLFVGGPNDLDRYSNGAPILTDNRMTLEFSAPRELHGQSGRANRAALKALLGEGDGPAIVDETRASTNASEWRNLAAMMERSDEYETAYDLYGRALTLNPHDAAALDGVVRTATLTRRSTAALARIESLTANRPPSAAMLTAMSKLLAANGSQNEAVDAAKRASRFVPIQASAVEQLASLYADAADIMQLDAALVTLREIAPHAPATHYYSAASAFMRGQLQDAASLAERAMAIDANYAPVYDLAGAIYTRMDRTDDARRAFETSLRFNAHDSTAYTNLGLLELGLGNAGAAVGYFAEALWLAPESATAREGLRRAVGATHASPLPRGRP